MKMQLVSFTNHPKTLPAILDEQFGRVAGRYTYPETVCEHAGRVCYKSDAKMGEADQGALGSGFLRKCITAQHLDVLEHAWATYEIDMGYEDRTVPQRLREASRFVEVDDLDDRAYLVSANLRVWRDLIEKDVLPGAWDALMQVAPKVFDDMVLGKAQAAHYAQRKWGVDPLPPYAGVTLLGYNLPVVEGMRSGTLEGHGQAVFEVERISRAATHQLVRHRMASFCLAGDTVVPSFRTGRGTGKQWTMKQLWDWQNDPQRSGRLKLMRLRGVNEQGELIPVKIGKVIYSGAQQLWRVTTESGRVIRSTKRHRYLSPARGWCRLDELAVGDSILANGVPAYQNAEYLHQRYLVENVERKVLAGEIGVSDSCLGTWIRRFGLQKPKGQYPGRKPGRGRTGAISEAGRTKLRLLHTGEASPAWRGDAISASGGHLRAIRLYVASECSRCGSDVRVQRHHVNGDPTDNSAENIAILCESCHKAEHFGQVVMTAFPDRITSIEPDRIEDTYDLEIDHPCHNFVADGFVVHNSQESQRYVELDKGQWEIVVPPSIMSNPDAYQTLAEHWDRTGEAYRKLRSLGIRKEDARFVLPNATESRIVVSMNFRYWRHFVWLRALDKAAQWEIRAIAQQILRHLYRIAPSQFVREMDALSKMPDDEVMVVN